jgi:PIN domain nuclease of toxin-antitoxin system
MVARQLKALLDTHSAVFLWEGRTDVWDTASLDLIQKAVLYISPLTRLELKYLKEVGKIKVSPDEILGGLIADCGVVQLNTNIAEVVSYAMNLDWTRDPFDRLLSATALLHDIAFITKDRKILKHLSCAVW